MAPVLAAVLSPFFGVTLSYGIINGFFWLAGTFTIYYLTKLLLREELYAYISALLYATSRPLLYYGAAVLTDAPGYFFTGLIIYLTFLGEEKNVSGKFHLTSGLICASSIFFKESSVLPLGFLLARRIQKRKGALETIIAFAVVACVLVAFLYSLGYGLSVYLEKFASASAWGHRGHQWDFAVWLQTILRSFSPLVLLAPLGIKYFKSMRTVMCLLFLLPLSFTWSVMTERFTFGLYPIIIPIIVAGLFEAFSLARGFLRLDFDSKLLAYAVVLLVALYNNYATFRVYGYPPLPIRL